MIYFIRSEDYIKIGYSTDPWLRMASLQTGNPKPLEMIAVCPGDYEMERELSLSFKDYHYRGEWFHRCGPIESYCETMRSIFPWIQFSDSAFQPLPKTQNGIEPSLLILRRARMNGLLDSVSENALNDIGISRHSNHPETPAAKVMQYLVSEGMVEYVGDRKPYRWTSPGVDAFPSPND